MFFRLLSKRSYNDIYLHRWCNVNLNCKEKMSKCMALKWEDYSSKKNYIVIGFNENNIGKNNNKKCKYCDCIF